MKEDELTASTPAVQTIDAPRRRDLTVAFFSDSLPERNGTGAYYHDLCALLAQEVSHLKMFQPRGAVRYPRLAIPMPGDPTQKLISPNVIRITREFHQLRPDIVVVVTPGPFGMLGQFLSRQLGVPCLTAFHTDFEQLARIYWDPLSRKIVNGYLRRVNRALCRGSKAVLVNNEGLRDQVCELGAEKVEVMGTPLPRIFLDRPLSPLPEAIEQIAFAGRFAAEKNVDQIIKAAAHFPAIRFLPGRGRPDAEGIGKIRPGNGECQTSRLAEPEPIGRLDRQIEFSYPAVQSGDLRIDRLRGSGPGTSGTGFRQCRNPELGRAAGSAFLPRGG
jgi:glycosyltransferase involved in cell wall biosynthesis